MPRRSDDEFVFGNNGGDARDCSDDEEANEDLSLKILEKALSRRDVGNKQDSKESGTTIVVVNGRKAEKTMLEDADETSIVSKEEEEEPKPGETASNLVLKKLLRGARYFDPPDAGWVSCYSCGEQGHITVNCPTPTKRRKPCFICGSLEHGAKQCSKGQDCYICKKSGHRAKDCPDKYKSGAKSAVCLRCGDVGHDMILCKYEYSHQDLKDIQCYVCKSFGHLCCVEPGNSPSWAVSCYRCGQLGHTGLACGRYYEESTEKDSASSCFKCGGEGHFKRDCPNSSSVSYPENGRDIASACYRCGEEGHFSRECPNSSSISNSQGRDSPSLCYKCNESGHFARACPNSSQVSKRSCDPSTPSHRSRKKIKENSEHISTANESNGKTKKKKEHKEDRPKTISGKPKHRGGWITEDPEEDSFQRGKSRRASSPITPTTPMDHNHKPIFSSNRRLPGSQSTAPNGRNHRNLSFESSGHLSDPPPSRWQPYYPPSHHHRHHHHHQHHQHHQHNQHHRYAPAPSRYGPANHYGEFAGNYDRW